jgi:peroxiredoxin
VARAYGVITPLRPYPYRWTFIIGAERKILHIDRQVKPKSHGLDIATMLKTIRKRVEIRP